MSVANPNAVEIIGHRGASHDAPENTLAAFRLGWEQKADANELDVHLSKDGQIIVIHDENTGRTTGLDMPVSQQSLAELRVLDAGCFKGPQWRGEKVPALAEVVATLPDHKRLFIEIKGGPEILPALEQVLAASGRPPGQFAIISFDEETMRQAKQRLPLVQGYLLASLGEQEPCLALAIGNLTAKALAIGADGLDLEAGPQMDAAVVAMVHKAGLQIYAWTVDDPALAAQLAAAGVDGITTNRPGWIRDKLT